MYRSQFDRIEGMSEHDSIRIYAARMMFQYTSYYVQISGNVCKIMLLENGVYTEGNFCIERPLIQLPNLAMQYLKDGFVSG